MGILPGEVISGYRKKMEKRERIGDAMNREHTVENQY
jgi:hypothetical protein